MKKALLLAVVLGLTVLLSASLLRKKETVKTPSGCSFYYWKTSLSFDKAEKALADSLGLKRLYLRYFDVDWSPTLEMPVPVGKLDLGNNYNGSFNQVVAHIGDYQVIPTIYLVNRVFEKNINADTLAAQISRKIAGYNVDLSYQTADWGNNYERAEEPSVWYLPDSLMPYTQFQNRINEIQLDCDWTPKTRDRYFKFLKAMKKANPGMAISCTVRLHQFRDREQAGIPPADRGTLMCYNMAAPKDFATRDAVFDEALVNGYLKNGEYPLALEAALPLFSWGALFHENQFKGLAAGLSEKDVKGNPLFAPVSEGKYRFTQDTVFANAYMRQGDLVRLDEASPEEVAALAGQLSKIKAVKNISFFDWNPSRIREYHVHEICKKFGR